MQSISSSESVELTEEKLDMVSGGGLGSAVGGAITGTLLGIGLTIDTAN